VEGVIVCGGLHGLPGDLSTETRMPCVCKQSAAIGSVYRRFSAQRVRLPRAAGEVHVRQGLEYHLGHSGEMIVDTLALRAVPFEKDD
jgi:hypothetical protein